MALSYRYHNVHTFVFIVIVAAVALLCLESKGLASISSFITSSSTSPANITEVVAAAAAVPVALCNPNTSIVQIIKRESNFLVDNFQNDLTFCRAHNIVPGPKRGKPKRVPFSVTEKDFGRHHSQQQEQKNCRTSTELLLAVQKGHREWDDAQRQGDDSQPSFFVPAFCDIPPMTFHRACDILQQFSSVILIGDSLLRHLLEALYSVLRNDLILGGIITTYSPTTFDTCRCDGQYSEFKGCRQNDGFFDHLTHPRQQLGICSHTTNNFQIYYRQLTGAPESSRAEDFVILPELYRDCSTKRPVLLYMNAATHHHMNASIVMEYFLERILGNNTDFLSKCQNDSLVIVYEGAGSQSRSLDEKYPHQSREHARLFNQDIFQRIKSRFPAALVVDYGNMTKDSQSSDGLHYLMDVNLQKSFVLLNLVELILQERKS